MLSSMNQLTPHTVAMLNDKVIGYALAMDRSFAKAIPLLIPMFKEIDSVLSSAQTKTALNYLVMGQVCIDKAFRSQGLFPLMYEDLRSRFHLHYDALITEVATRNERSINAHLKHGFESISIYSSSNIEWNVLQWLWK